MKLNILRIFITFFFLTSIGACSSDATDPLDPKYGTPDPKENSSEGQNGDILPKATSIVDVAERVMINPQIFGVNNDWRQIPDTEFSNFSENFKNIGATILRYPGGWESEYYKWDSNTTPGWDKTPDKVGASVQTMKSNIHSFSIVLPTAIAMNEDLNSNAFNTALDKLKETAINAIGKVGKDDVKIVEIGNEWWLQWGGGVSRAEKLDKYTVIAMNIAEKIGQTFPDRSFKLLINGDYTKPEEFTTMKNGFKKGYDLIDGVALHTYSGYETDEYNIIDLGNRIKACANNFNQEKNFKYLSEWMPSRAYNDKRLYMEAANIIPDIFQEYAMVGTDAAAFWPPVNTSIPGVGLFNSNFTTIFPVGQIFGELSKSFKGEVVRTSGDKFHITASLNDSRTLVLFVTGKDEPASQTTINVKNFSVSSIESVERFVPADYTQTDKAAPYKTEDGKASLSLDNAVILNINKEGSYQIYKIVLKGNVQ